MTNFFEIEEFKEFNNKNVHLILLKADISLLINIDCIVNCTGPKFDHKSGVAKAITLGAGKNLEQEFKNYLSNNKFLKENDVLITPSFNLTQYKNILHVRSQNDSSSLRSIYDQLFRTCFDQLNFSSIAVPVIGTGEKGLALDVSVKPIIDSLNNISVSKNVQVIIVNNSNNQYSKCVEIIRKLMSAKNDEYDQECPICLEKIRNPKLLEICGHVFCKECIDQCFIIKKECPLCKQSYGLQIGNQPVGRMRNKRLDINLPGFDSSIKTIQIEYSFDGGIQGPEHPNPGVPYSGILRKAYLPDDSQGRHVLSLLERAFQQRLIFTIGQSRTNGRDNVITWNDIHHKTNISGGPTHFGYPDPNYIQRVTYELASKGIK